MARTTFSGPVRSTNGFEGAIISTPPTPVTTATFTATQDVAGDTIVLDRAGGIAVTLPAATGTGSIYRFFIKTTFTSPATIKCANSVDVMQGFAVVLQDAGDTMVGFETAADTDTITFNGNTTGGLRGTLVDLIDVEAGLWSVNMRGAATGVEATPFSATV